MHLLDVTLPAEIQGQMWVTRKQNSTVRVFIVTEDAGQIPPLVDQLIKRQGGFP